MIEMQNVSFSYPDSADGGLKNINLTIPDEQCVLLCGRSGCGKTTINAAHQRPDPAVFRRRVDAARYCLDGENPRLIFLCTASRKRSAAYFRTLGHSSSMWTPTVKSHSAWKTRLCRRNRWDNVWWKQPRHSVSKTCWAAISLLSPAGRSRKLPLLPSMR